MELTALSQENMAPSMQCIWARAAVVLSDSVGCGGSACRELVPFPKSGCDTREWRPQKCLPQQSWGARDGDPGQGEASASSAPGLGSPGFSMETQEGLTSIPCPPPPSPYLSS